MVSSADLLDTLKAHPQFAQQLQDPGFEFMVSSHLLLHELVTKHIPLKRAPTKVSDSQGVFLRQAPSPPNSSSTHNPTATPTSAAPAGPIMRVQTLQPEGSESHIPVDWAHHTLALSPFYCYSKSSVFTKDTSLVPHFELEMGVSPGQREVLLYINMDPKLSMTMSPGYLDHFYLTAPPTYGNSSSKDSGSNNPGGGSSGSSSWADLEARAGSDPGFTRFTSPDLHVRAFSSTAILFKVKEAGWSSAREVVKEAVSICVAWALVKEAGWSTAREVVKEAVSIWVAWALVGDSAQATACMSDSTNAGADIAARSWAWRRFPRRERAGRVMVGVFGEQVMGDYWDSMAGDPRIRL